MGRSRSTTAYPWARGRLPLIILTAILVLLLCVLLIIIVFTLTREKTLTYSVKFACVPEVGTAEIVDSEAPFEPAVYRTAINIHNFTDKTIEFTKKAVLARSQDVERGPISEQVTELLGPDEALFIDCLDISNLLEDQLAGQTAPPGDGFVVIKSSVELDVVAVYTTRIMESKQEILFRIVTEPFKVRAISANGSGPDELPDPGGPPNQGFRAEVLNVDFEKTFNVLNKVIYGFELKPKGLDCSESDKCEGTREVLIPAPGVGVPFPDPYGPEEEAKSLEQLVRKLDPSFQKILDVDATLAQRDEIKQEVTYRWVSDPVKIVVQFQPDLAVNVSDIVEDEDRDGLVNEDPVDGVDNDNDGAVDEDAPLAPGQEIEILDTDLAIGVGESEDVEREQIAPIRRFSTVTLALLFLIIALIIILILVIVFFLIRKRLLPKPQHPVKVLCGVLKVDDNNLNDGDAEINFQPHSVGGDATGADLFETGDGAGHPYLTQPCVEVSVTKIANGRDNFEWEVKTRGLTTARVHVNWDSDHVEIHEISYMVVGITEE